MMIKTVQEALEVERNQISFSPQKISQFIYGKEFYHKMRATLDKYQVPVHDFNQYNEGRVGCILKSIKDFPVIYNNFCQEGLTDINTTYMTLASTNQMPGGIHLSMFVKCIEILGTDQQHKEYLEKCKRYEVFGAYAQTEMGHGSDVSSLMTTATFDMENQQFIIHTPNIKAIKFWPGQMGIYSTHALIFAQLIIDNKKYGVHSFIVPMRDKDMKLLPGIQAGDIGPKIGYHSKDNGYMILNNVRIPRKNMLTRFISVSKDGKLKIKGDPKISYAAMMDIRKHLSSSSPKIYSQGITIATRYSIFRRQFQNHTKEEIKIMNYQLQQQKIIPRVSEYFAITLAGNKIRELNSQNVINVVEKQNFSLMAETHACLSLGKAYFGEIVFDGLEILRKSCGGHGFSQYSGFPSLIHQYSPYVTLEGENTVLYLQVARFLLKSFKHYKMKKKELSNSVKYIQSFQYLMEKRVQANQPSKWTVEDIRVIIAQSVCYLLNTTTVKLLSKEDGYSDKDAWNYTSGIRLRQLAMVHSIYFTYQSFREAVVIEKDEKIRDIAEKLCLLYGIGAITSSTISSAILQGNFVSGEQISSLHELKQELLIKIRPNIIGIVDGFGIPEKYLRSALISGNPYDNYLKLAKQNNINHKKLESLDVLQKITQQLRNPNPSL